jgi:hypothetical protein
MPPKPSGAPTCPTCGKPAPRTNTRFGPRYDCCGLTAWGDEPLATQETLKARREAHAAFDPIWKDGHLPRNAAYALLAEHLGMRPRDTHMALMDEATALRVPEAADAIRHTLGIELDADAALPRGP